MCGIFGVIALDGVCPSIEDLQKPAELIQHRGPDYTGVIREPGFGFAHTRLSILDLSDRSNQPFWDETGRYALIYNGEIYNFGELRQRLMGRGVRFRTTGDTEVLLQALIHEGESVLPELMGMFAFCFYDRQTQRALLCRDRFGIKPLYYSVQANRVIFSSEQAPIHHLIKSRPDMSTIFAYLMGFGGPHRNHSFFDGIQNLAPGHLLRISGADVSEPEPFFKLSSFWSPELHQELCQYSDKQVVDRLDELLNESVRKHMIADTPVAALCSGGVDSSLILALAARQNDNLSIFHSDVVGRNSERDAAEALARHLNLDLKIVEVRDQDFIDSIPKVTRHYSQPFAYHPNCVPFLKVTELVHANNIKVILTGEAADESYLGYSHIPTEDMVSKVQLLVGGVSSALRKNPVLERLLFSDGRSNNNPLVSLMSRYEEVGEYQQLAAELNAVNAGTFDSKNLKTFRYLTYHLRTLLHRNDTLGMASSIEARFPFLDHETIRFACNLPYKHKIRFAGSAAKEKKHPFLMTKWVLRQVADRYLPEELSYRPKKGFPTDAFERMLIDPKMFKDSFVGEMFNVSSGEMSHLGMLPDKNLHMRLMLLEVWGRTFFMGQSQTELQSLLRDHVRIPAA